MSDVEFEIEIQNWVNAVELVQEMKDEEDRLARAYLPLQLELSHKSKTPELNELGAALTVIRKTIGEHELILGLRAPGFVTTKDNTDYS